MKTLFLLDSGDPDEYRQICELAKKNNSEIWGATTNPSLIAKKLADTSAPLGVNKKVSPKEAFKLQKQIVLEIANIVPGAVSAEVYADENTKAEELIGEGREIAKWHMRIIVKLPTTIEGFKARTALRKEGITVNNTLVFSQEQVFAICLHEQIIQNSYNPIKTIWPSFISPFVGRLDDIGQNGMDLVKNSMSMKEEFGFNLWMLEASVRKSEHIKLGIDYRTELMTAPAKVYNEWFEQSTNQQMDKKKKLEPIPYWNPSDELLSVEKIGEFMHLIESGQLNIHHELTDKGVVRFATDWKAIIA
ncbi:MAG: transaldolase family protein [bacterium]|nr:transaldolase family protein [bacterium]